MNTTISIYENNVWATDAHLSTSGWQDGAQLSRDEETDDAIYAAIRTSVRNGETAGEVEADGSIYSWRAA